MNFPTHLPPHEIKQFPSFSYIGDNPSIARYHPLPDNGLHYIPMHSHDFYEINIIMEGSAAHYIEKRMISSPTGTVFVIPPSVNHGYYSLEETKIFHMMLNQDFISSYNETLKKLKGFDFLFEVEPLLRPTIKGKKFLCLESDELDALLPEFNRLIQYSENNTPNKTIILKHLTISVIAELCGLASITQMSNNDNDSSTDTYIREMTDIIIYINNHFNENIDYQKLSKTYNLTYSTFFRHFKKLLKMSPSQYQNHRRIEESIKLLKSGDKSLSDMALECGFYDSAHFSRTFKKIQGDSPYQMFKSVPNKKNDM